MRIATWNINRPRSTHTYRRAEIDRHICNVNADVWVLTETHQTVVPGPPYTVVSSDTPDDYNNFEVGERWVSIWSKFPLISVLPTADPVRTACATFAVPGRRPLIVYGTVLPWVGSPWRGVPARDGAAFRAALDLQRDDWMKFQEEHRDHDFCLAGDFNQYLLVVGHYYGPKCGRVALQVSLSAARLECVTGGNQDPVYLATAGVHACIDHICLSFELAGLHSPPAGTWLSPAERCRALLCNRPLRDVRRSDLTPIRIAARGDCNRQLFED